MVRGLGGHFCFDFFLCRFFADVISAAVLTTTWAVVAGGGGGGGGGAWTCSSLIWTGNGGGGGGGGDGTTAGEAPELSELLGLPDATVAGLGQAAAEAPPEVPAVQPSNELGDNAPNF